MLIALLLACGSGGPSAAVRALDASRGPPGAPLGVPRSSLGDVILHTRGQDHCTWVRRDGGGPSLGDVHFAQVRWSVARSDDTVRAVQFEVPTDGTTPYRPGSQGFLNACAQAHAVLEAWYGPSPDDVWQGDGFEVVFSEAASGADPHCRVQWRTPGIRFRWSKQPCAGE